MQPFFFCLAVGPLAIYLMMLGIIDLARRPVVVSGARESAALALAVSGFVVVGPMQLFMPQVAAARFGPLVWLVLLGLYALGVLLWILLSKPRLVIYNIDAEQMRAVLSDVARRFDHEASWAGDCLLLPTLGVQLTIEDYPSLRKYLARG